MKRSLESISRARGMGRRQLLTGSVGALATAASSRAAGQVCPATTVPSAVADAHVHLFNASDLPIGGFARYVIVPERFPGSPGAAKAAEDLLNRAKSWAVTVAEERGPGAGDVSPRRFGDLVLARVDELEGRAGAAQADPALAESYRDLGAVLAFDKRRFGDAALLGQMMREPGAPAASDGRQALRRAFVSTADDEERSAAEPPGTGLLKSMSQLELAPAVAGPASEFASLVGWAYTMCQGRRAHLRKYLRDYSAGSARPRLIVNHLVDYDMWLGDGPAPASSHLAQIAFLQELAADHRGQAELHTFAGFCPLKHAMETARDGRPTTFLALQNAVRQGAVAGFKLYPPMGFRALGNAARPGAAQNNDDFKGPGGDPGQGSGGIVVGAWEALVGPRGPKLGAALDASLRDFYRFCAASSVPIMAHAGPGNEAGPGFGQNAHPKYWEAALREFPQLRLSLGHLVSDARVFVRAEQGKPEPDDPPAWALQESRQLLRPGSGPGAVYGDLGYMPELIGDRKGAADFFRTLYKVFGPNDPEMTRILYGSDWIMMGLEPKDRRYLRHIVQGMRDACYSQAAMDNILWRNTRRFLRLAA